jgi:diguanylate cyclase (GGDEF)-like protein
LFYRAAATDRDTTAHASHSWRQRYHPHFPTALVALIGLFLSLMASTMVWHWETKTATQHFQTAAATHFIVLQNGINDYLSKLRALHALFAASRDRVTRDEFETFARPVLQYNTAIQTLSWVPRVLHSERAAHELAGAGAGLSNYHIKSRIPDGSMIPSAEQDEYFPVFFATVPKASPLYGLDLASVPTVRAELEHARDGNQLGFSEIPVLVSAGGTQPGFVFSLPIYRSAVPGSTIEERRRNLQGFVHGSIITSRMIEIALDRGTPPQGIDTFFFDPNGRPAMDPMYVHKSRLHEGPIERELKLNSSEELHASHTLVAENEPWLTATALPVRDGPLAVHHHRTWLVFGTALAVTLLVSLHVGSTVRFTRILLKANDEISALAHRDPLTGLVNRRSFNEHLGSLFAATQSAGRSYSILYFDLDHFKDVNDTLGHPIGDLLLQKVAARVTKIVRKGDVVARFGGDEFAILQNDSNIVAPATLATRLLETISRPFVLNGDEIHITASIGIARNTTGVSSPDASIMQADLALYRAKADGRNCFRFHGPDLDREVHDRVVTAEELRKALTREELRLYYQPQMDLRSGRIIGVEALVRWLHPSRGLLAPLHFISIAERTGSIIAIGSWAFDEACRQLKSWSDLGLSPGVVAINVSAKQFNGGYDPEKDLATALEKWCIEPLTIEVELTESVLMELTQQHSDSLARLKRLGVRIAIDDFGTGYSSLNYLTKFPVSRLKIAQELVFGVADDSRNATVVRAAIHLASELGIECIAEGIENEKQVDFLIKAGCHHGQGYYFGKAMAAAEMTTFLKEAQAKVGRAGPRLTLVA